MARRLSVDSSIQILPVTSRGDLRDFVKFPWRVYRGDPNWVPPLISEQISYLTPSKNKFFNQAEVALFSARRGRELAGTIAAFIDPIVSEYLDERVGGFGFFEVIEDYDAAEGLLDTACEWLQARKMTRIMGPTNFSGSERPGILVKGADCPPVMYAGHTPPYYKDFLERYGMEKDHDLFAYRAFRSQIGEGGKNIPPELTRVAEAAQKAMNAKVRKVDMDNWEEEVKIAHFLFNDTLKDLPGYVPLSEDEFVSMASQMRLFLDPDLALFAEVDGEVAGFCVAIPDVNRMLIHLNGRLFPFNWLKIKKLIRQIDVVSFKLMGVLDKFRRRGIEAMLYLEVVKAVYEKGYAWLDGSVTAEENKVVNLMAQRLGAEQYKHYRVYKKAL
jgi:GNAT superfamily N-acetyltransferase